MIPTPRVTHVEVTSKPWFGPRRRARETLAAHRHGVVASPEECLAHIRKIVGPAADSITNARFIDYVHTKEHFRYTILICWTPSDPELRQALFERASAIVDLTGWYPLPQGERLRSVESGAAAPGGAPHGALPSLKGRLRTMEAAVPPEGGCSIRLTLSSGDSLLLDSGLPDQLALTTSDRLLLLSHAHADHAGGLTSGRVGKLTTAMTVGTASVLNRSGRIGRSQLDERCVIARHGERLSLGSVTAEPFLVPHFPGASGWIVRDDDTSVIFTGDICLRTARHDFLDALTSLVSSEKPRHPTVLLDATMAGRAAGASAADVAGDVVDELEVNPDVVILAESPDPLLYAYLDLFHRVQQSEHRHSVSFLASGQLRTAFQIVHHAFLTRDAEMLDPLLTAQYGATMSSWGESRWLYWCDGNFAAPSGRRIWLLTTRDLESIDLPTGAALVPVGREAILDRLDPLVSAHHLRTDSSPWTAHSDAASLADACRALATEGAEVVLFHNFSKRMKKFVRDEQLISRPLSGTMAVSP